MERMMKVALVGAGGIGHSHGNAYLQLPGVKITAVVDIRLEKAEEVAEEHGAKAYSTLESMLQTEDVDMVDICVPSYLHKEFSLKCMERKLHVLCEKPIAHTLEDAQAMVDAAERTGVKFMIAQVIRFWPEYMYLKKVYDEKTYGSLRILQFSRTSAAPAWSWRNWYLDPHRSRKAPFELHIHDADFICYLLGLPKRVQSWLYEQDELNFSHIKTRYIYNEALLIEAEGGWYRGTLPFSATYRAVFERGLLEYKDEDLVVYPSQKKAFHVDLFSGSEVPANINKNAVGMYNEIAYFVDCVRNDRPVQVVTPQDSLNSLRMLLIEMDSARSGNTLDV